VIKKINLSLDFFILPSFPPMSPFFACVEKTGDRNGFIGFLKSIFFDIFSKIL